MLKINTAAAAVADEIIYSFSNPLMLCAVCECINEYI